MASGELSRCGSLNCNSYHRIPDSQSERAVYELDLASMGYDPVKVRKFLGGNSALAKELLADRMPTLGNNKKGKHQELNLNDRSRPAQRPDNWVFFNPCSCSLDHVDKNDLPLIIKLAYFEPGNMWYLEQNTKSKAVRLRSEDKFPKGKCVQYTQNGPVLIEAVRDSGLDPPNMGLSGREQD